MSPSEFASISPFFFTFGIVCFCRCRSGTKHPHITLYVMLCISKLLVDAFFLPCEALVSWYFTGRSPPTLAC